MNFLAPFRNRILDIFFSKMLRKQCLPCFHGRHATAITLGEHLTLTLRYLATGDSYKSLMYLFRIPSNTTSTIIPEVCSAIFDVFKNEYLKEFLVRNTKTKAQLGSIARTPTAIEDMTVEKPSLEKPV